MKKEFTKQEKTEYFNKIRREWKISKAMSENDLVTEALFREAGIKGISYSGFYYVITQMRALKLEGLPYVDAKTFAGWKECGYKVKKGEKSKLNGVVWLGTPKKEDDDEEDIFLYPKVYHLFHKTQVEEI